MAPELVALTCALFLQGVQFATYSVLANLQIGPRTAMGPRDQTVVLTGAAGRAQRALNNHFEGLILFTGAVVVITLADKSSGFSAACAWAYLISRVLYVPAYIFGWTPWRSLIWAVGFCATFLMLFSAAVF